jgi:hypothetical protein
MKLKRKNLIKNIFVCVDKTYYSFNLPYFIAIKFNINIIYKNIYKHFLWQFSKLDKNILTRTNKFFNKFK